FALIVQYKYTWRRCDEKTAFGWCVLLYLDAVHVAGCLCAVRFSASAPNRAGCGSRRKPGYQRKGPGACTAEGSVPTCRDRKQTGCEHAYCDPACDRESA